MTVVDLNCDMGESFGAYTIGMDEEILDVITSANIACAYHAGDPKTMHKTVKLALEKSIGIGAHPGLPDLNGFGRRRMALTPDEVYDIVVYQVGALQGFVKAEGGTMQHVKPHGALYNMAATDSTLAASIAKAVVDIDDRLILFGLSGSELIRAGKEAGLRTASEVFADRTYQKDGSLTPRTQENALITDETVAVQQALNMVQKGCFQSQQGVPIQIQADTICIHGDGSNALKFAKKIKQALKNAGVVLEKPYQ